MRLSKQAAARLVDDPTGGAEQQQHLEQRRQVFHLAVAEVVIVIGGFIADAHRQPGDAGGDKIGERVDPFGYQANTAGKNAGDEFARGQ